MRVRSSFPRRLTFLAFGLAVLTGCPTDDVNADVGSTETGGEESPPPVDPLDGEGSNPPGDPDPNASWGPAKSLGNGMVHDSRYDLDAVPRTIAVSGAELASGIDWTGFVDEHQAKVSVGFRPTQVHGIVELAPIGGGNFELTITDRSVYVSDDDANYRTETRTYIFRTPEDEQRLLPSSGSGSTQAPRPTAIDTFSIPDDLPPVGVSVVWTYDANPVPWRLIVGQPQGEFVQTVASLREQGFRPISLASRLRAGELEYAAIFVADGTSNDAWRVTLGVDGEAVAAAYDENWEDGYFPSQRSYAHGSDDAPRHNLIWTQRPPGLLVEVRENLDQASFEQQDKFWRTSGYHLESANAYVEDGALRHHGTWAQYQPYMRWQGTDWDENDPVYVARYEPLHQQAMTMMTLAGSGKEGDYFRPSATLHIFEGDELVLSRAYTYAPAIYPDTPVNAPMALASVAKSITAAAVVRELGQQGLPLTMPFWTAVGISPFPSQTAVPTVADVLRNLGGFVNPQPSDSYYDHGLVANSGYGPLPISGEAMFNYAEGENLFTAGQACMQNTDCTNIYGNDWSCDLSINACVSEDHLWLESLYATSQSDSTLTYSNPGFTMLGELVRVRSGTSYPQYVIQNFLVPLGLEDDIYPDKGHRYLHPEVPRSSLRGYLIQEDHPYRLGTDALLGSSPVPQPAKSDGSTPDWEPNAGPPDSAAPMFADKERYAGEFYMGGAQLAAGGWVGRGEALGRLMRAVVRTDELMPFAVSSQLWNPAWWNNNHKLGIGWQYVLGWYARGNWVAWAGGTAGAMTVVVHNRSYDFTIVFLANVLGQPFAEFLHPLLDGKGAWSQPNSPQSTLGGQFPCQDDFFTAQNECMFLAGAPY